MYTSFRSKMFLAPLPTARVSQLTAIYELKGKERLYEVQRPDVLEKLQTDAVIESTESSNRIEGVIASPERVREIVSRGASPTTRSEAEIAGYRDVLGQIHASYPFMAVTPNIILQLHRDMYKYGGGGGVWKTVDNTIQARMPDGTTEIVFQPVPSFATAMAMDELCDEYKRATAESVADPLLCIGTFVLDFLCIHPFLDGNGRVARLLTTLLLYRAGFNVPRYIGMERLIEESKVSYYESLRLSSERWREGKHTVLPWWEYFLGITLRAYRQLDALLVGGEIPPKGEQVRRAVLQMPIVFAKTELARACPSVSTRTVKRVLEEMRDEGRIELTTRGRTAMWRKV